MAPFCRRPGKAPFRWTRVGLRPLRSYRKQGVGKGSLTINKYVGRRLRLLLLRTRRGQILAAVEAGVVCLGLGQVQSAAELPAFAPTGGLSYAQLSALIPHGFRQRPGVGCSPPAITDKEARRGQGGAGPGLGTSGTAVLRSSLKCSPFFFIETPPIWKSFKRLRRKMQNRPGLPFPRFLLSEWVSPAGESPSTWGRTRVVCTFRITAGHRSPRLSAPKGHLCIPPALGRCG